jgi:regulator of protease activity HflC (stomatin/prohibitin superfamily)
MEDPMLLLKYLLLVSGFGLLGVSTIILAFDAYRAAVQSMVPVPEGTPGNPIAWRWKAAVRLAAIAAVPLLVALSIVVIPSGHAAVRVSQLSGTVPGTLYPGTHFLVPLVQHAEVYDVRDVVFATSAIDNPKQPTATLKAQSREGLAIGLGVTVRYRLDPARLASVHDSLPRAIDADVVAPVVASAFRQSVPNYMVREAFATRREEVRLETARAITRRLAGDGILVKEVMLRDIQLPPEYARGLEGLLLKEQESERLTIELDVKAKEVKSAELEAEAEKIRQVKAAEGQAQITVLQAKAQADAMQHTLPLKEKQIQQTRLEAEARKEATVKNAEAAAMAKVIDSKAELERQGLLAKAEEQRIRLIAGADAERMRAEAQVLKDNPLVIQKIIAERLSDKVQVMMVPMDGKFFFANDVLKGTQFGMAGSK